MPLSVPEHGQVAGPCGPPANALVTKQPKPFGQSILEGNVADTEQHAAPMGPIVKRTIVKYLNDELLGEVVDDMAREEPLDIHVDGSPYAITMRLPGDDINLVTGFCLTEGLIDSADDLAGVEHCRGEQGEGRVLVTLRRRAHGVRDRKGAYVSKSSCGVCGKQQLDEIYGHVPAVTGERVMGLRRVLGLKAAFESRKDIFPIVGSTHSAAVFDHGGEMVAFAEDIGRHNALDKAIGALVGGRLQERAYIAILSSRLSFEMVQKAAAAGIEVLAGVSAATTLAARFAEERNITLIGFLRRNRMNIYTHPKRIDTAN